MIIEYRPVGTIHSPFTGIEKMPIQASGAKGVRGRVEVFPQFDGGLEDLEGFSHIILLYHFHRCEGFELKVIPFLDSRPHGVFATRAPRRPNPVGLSVVKVLTIENGTIHIENVDILDGTPLLDIKPYVPDFDVHPADRTGWLAESAHRARRIQSDQRFAAGKPAPQKPAE